MPSDIRSAANRVHDEAAGKSSLTAKASQKVWEFPKYPMQFNGRFSKVWEC